MKVISVAHTGGYCGDCIFYTKKEVEYVLLFMRGIIRIGGDAFLPELL